MVRRARQATPRDLDRRRPPLNPSPAVLRVPILRAEGKVFAEGYPTLGATELVHAPVLLRESRSDSARAAEASFGFEPSLYFYVGFSHPSFGDVVLVYEPEYALAGTLTDTLGVFVNCPWPVFAAALKYFTAVGGLEPAGTPTG